MQVAAAIVLTCLAGGSGWIATAAARAPRAAQDEADPSADGRALFDLFCAPCHGDDGKGGGSVAMALKAAPPDLTALARRHGGAYPRERVERYVTDGSGELHPAHASGRMPLWGPTFRSLDPSPAHATQRIAAVVSYVERLQDEIRIADGSLRRGTSTDSSFRVGPLTIRVAADGELQRWLAAGLGRRAVVMLVSDRGRALDIPGARRFSGRSTTAMMPAGSSAGRMLSLQEDTGRLAPVTLETSDAAIAATLVGRDDTVVNLVIAIRQ